MQYLLDANVVSDLVRNPKGEVFRNIRRVGELQVCTSIIVAAELRYGAVKKGSQKLTSRLDLVLNALEILPFDKPADLVYGNLRTQLEHAGLPIGANDLLIAAHALALGLIIVTDNEREFSRIAQLSCENWLR
ncbi:MAG: PIN domain-containing protein [Acidobacteriaceae bacterium]|nr:PIN domain-containing protein [Acidobacteriaceae bacterium]MBV8569555.1 PIN domain-containing protein [Acidobacteriaceae bacterium]